MFILLNHREGKGKLFWFLLGNLFGSYFGCFRGSLEKLFWLLFGVIVHTNFDKSYRNGVCNVNPLT